MVCTFVTTIPGPWKRRARSLPIGQIQAVPGNFLLSDSPRSETRLAHPSHDLLCRSTSSSSSSPPSPLPSVPVQSLLLRNRSLTSSSRCNIHSRSLETRFLAFLCVDISSQCLRSVINLNRPEHNVLCSIAYRQSLVIIIYPWIFTYN